MSLTKVVAYVSYIKNWNQARVFGSHALHHRVKKIFLFVSGPAPVAATAHIFCSFYAIDLPDAIYAVYFCRDLQLIPAKRPFTLFTIEIENIFFPI